MNLRCGKQHKANSRVSNHSKGQKRGCVCEKLFSVLRNMCYALASAAAAATCPSPLLLPPPSLVAASELEATMKTKRS